MSFYVIFCPFMLKCAQNQCLDDLENGDRTPYARKRAPNDLFTTNVQHCVQQHANHQNQIRKVENPKEKP